MPISIRFHLDEHLARAIAHALQRVGIDITTTNEAGLRTHPDENQWAYAQREARVMVTSDTDFLRIHNEAVTHEGIVFFHKDTRTLREIIEGLALIHGAMTPDEMRGYVEFL